MKKKEIEISDLQAWFSVFWFLAGGYLLFWFIFKAPFCWYFIPTLFVLFVNVFLGSIISYQWAKWKSRRKK